MRPWRRWLERGLRRWLDADLGDGAGRATTRFAHHESPTRRACVAVSLADRDAYAAADLALTRAGAITVAELCAWGIPSVIVPLPTAAADHQTRERARAEAAGAARDARAERARCRLLGAALTALASAPDRLACHGRAALARGAGPNAAERIARMDTHDSTAKVGSTLERRASRPRYIPLTA